MGLFNSLARGPHTSSDTHTHTHARSSTNIFLASLSRTYEPSPSHSPWIPNEWGPAQGQAVSL